MIASAILGSCGGGGGGKSGGSSSSSGSTGASGDVPFIVVDQFGYLPDAEKVAVIRDPQQGFDADASYGPGATFEVVKADDDTVAYSGVIEAWKNGATDSYSGTGNNLSSGDRAWWFDFSIVTKTGEYYVRDQENPDVVSPVFTISADVYDEVLRQAMRTFFYQRAGYPKDAQYAGSAWADGASHLQDAQAQARLFNNDPDNPASARDLSGGWYDAGDYNKYTNWAADYVIGLLHAYIENPDAWNDLDLGIPESSNDIPDIIDEVKWGMDWLIKMQDASDVAGAGSVLSIVDLVEASPPSDATAPSRYGPASTSATLTTAAALALGATVFAKLDGNDTGDDDAYAADLGARAIAAWDWADAHPDETFQNNDGSNDLGAGQQEVGDAGRVIKKLEAAVYLFELTADSKYREYFDEHYDETELINNNFANEFGENVIHFLLYYRNVPNATLAVADDIRNKFLSAMNGRTAWGAINNETNPYRAPLLSYTWGSAGVKANKGSMFYEHILYNLYPNGRDETEVRNVAARYIHYLHGVNPLGKVYLSNMGQFGAENSVDQFYHTWFQHESELWDSVSESTYGPPPGFVVGGPNPRYDWADCCNSSTCGSPQNNAMCMRPVPPYNQPAQKSYADFNNSWPVNSWEVTENSNGYQIRYLRLLSKFVNN